MAIPLDYDHARAILEQTFAAVEAELVQGRPIAAIPDAVAAACAVIFQSETQSFREVLLGCVVAKILDRRVNVRQPYARQGLRAFGARGLDERVINPFLQEHQIPASRGAYLAVFRRSVQFVPATRGGLRDQKGYDAFLVVLEYLERMADDARLDALLRFVLRRFAELREAAQVTIQRLQRLSLLQYDALIGGLLATASGGRFPVLLVQAMVLAMKDAFGLDWEIVSQGINVADRPAGVGGDITIARNGTPLLVIEVTEQPVDRARLVATFRTKIAPAALADYLFVQRAAEIPAGVLQQAQQYFAQGHEVNFVEVRRWVLDVLATVGREGRNAFLRRLQDLIDSPEIPRVLKAAWNDLIGRIVQDPTV
jgi:hypothetical protein